MSTVIVSVRYGRGRTERFMLSFEGEQDCLVSGRALTLDRDENGVFLRGFDEIHRLRPNVLESFEYVGATVTALLEVGD